jgi:holo-[acyl-carrier protein] synthase
MEYLNGIDLVKIDRIKKMFKKSGQVPEEIFSEAEIFNCNLKKKPFESFAARFAAKEAIIKCVDSNILEFDLSKIEILNSSSGKPFVRINCERLQKKIKSQLKKDDYYISLSLSHEEDYSIASVIIY